MLSVLCFISLAAIALGATVAPQPCICTMEYMPVCGMDGKTYGNLCSLNCAGVEMAHVGECSEHVCPCPRIYKPVCGQDGKTYANQCLLNCAGIALFQEGVCTAVDMPANPLQADEEDIPCICTFIYLPVCGVDGVTYGNDCNRQCVGVGLSHQGPCLPSEQHTIEPPKTTQQ